MPNPYAGYAQSAIETLTGNWFTPQTPFDWVPMDYWKTPTISQELTFYMQYAGDNSYIQTLENARTQGECCLDSCGYYDDLTCWGRYFMTVYNYLTSGGGSGADPQNYLSDAQDCHQNFVAAWDQTCGGGIWWQRNPPSYPNNFKASNSTLGAIEIALGLYFATNNQQYLDWAQMAWTWLKNSQMIDSSGMVWGGLTSSCKVDPGNPPVVALQGNPLAPLWLLWKATGDATCLDIADTIIFATMKNMVWTGTEILQASSDADWNSQSQQWQEKHAGETPFKGIFAGFLGNFAASLAAMNDPKRQASAKAYAAFLLTNADTVYANFPAGNYGMDWHTPSPNYQINSDNSINACLQYGGLAVFLAAAQNS
jgi:glycosyl hydrolase family 76